ncbi:MAG: hypothetical protein IJC71_02375 [Clostridia bacterium]|nr:hypothetical protein [Clostridia bacterium]
MDLSKSIDFLLENGRDLLLYRLHRDVLCDLTTDMEETYLAKIRETEDYRLLLSHIHENGYIGRGMHSWEKFKTSHLDDGENAARYIANTGLPKDTQFVRRFVQALRDDAVLEEEFSYYNPEKARFKNRSIGLNSGSSLGVLTNACQAIMGYGDDDAVKPFVEISYRAFTSLLAVGSVDELTDYNPELKRKYNYPTITPDTYFPCQYHLETLAAAKSWRTPASVQLLADAINHHDRICTETTSFAVKIDGKQVGPGWAYMQPFHALSFPNKAPNHRKTLTCLAACVGEKADVVKKSRETLEEMLDADGILRTSFDSPYQKRCFKDNFRIAHPYAEIGLEPDHRKDTAVWCELTFWAVQFLTILERFEK